MSDGLLFFIACVAGFGWFGFRSVGHAEHGWRWWCWIDQLVIALVNVAWLWDLYGRLGEPWSHP